MGSLKLSTVVVTALVVCLSILLISPTEAVEGKLEVCDNMQIDLCLWWTLPLWWVDFKKICDEKCQSRNTPGAR
ncbi:putative low-molecular-weight cysteine-rich family [Arabidopsis thaliana]|nr:Low-molecular-weight cysteine-rich family [Arabidopsis thaliana x Arabidopsis arenosa]KAG7621377.1 Low-molecular-weight cysteine-rich family [Arabidopsis suecica]OAP00062.1 hypothetical protein AXX17_AT4G25790 [Arabidopsis thaliana]